MPNEHNEKIVRVGACPGRPMRPATLRETPRERWVHTRRGDIPPLWAPTPAGWLARLIDHWHDWRAGRAERGTTRCAKTR